MFTILNDIHYNKSLCELVQVQVKGFPARDSIEPTVFKCYRPRAHGIARIIQKVKGLVCAESPGGFPLFRIM